jgi:hypothetical protein
MTQSPLDWRISPGKLSDAELARHLEATISADRRRRASRTEPGSFADFCAYVYRLRVDEHHALWCDALEGVARGEISKLLLIAPPGHAKSTYTSIAFPTWQAGVNYRDSLICVTTTDPLSKLYGDTVKSVIEDSPGFERVFPDVKPDKKRGWSQDGLFLRGPLKRRPEQKDATITFVGAGGGVIGRRADGVVIDDVVDEATARSEILLGQRKTWIARTIFSRLQGSPKGWRVIAGTLWTEDDVVDTAMRTGEYVTVHMTARSPGSLVSADVWIPNGVQWRPRSNYEEVG